MSVLTAQLQATPLDLSVTVVGGVGQKTIPARVRLGTTCIVPANLAAVYDYVVLDDKGFGITGKTAITGSYTVTEDLLRINSGGSFHILNSTLDVVFNVRIYSVLH